MTVGVPLKKPLKHTSRKPLSFQPALTALWRETQALPKGSKKGQGSSTNLKYLPSVKLLVVAVAVAVVVAVAVALVVAVAVALVAAVAVAVVVAVAVEVVVAAVVVEVVEKK